MNARKLPLKCGNHLHDVEGADRANPQMTMGEFPGRFEQLDQVILDADSNSLICVVIVGWLILSTRAAAVALPSWATA